VEMGRGQGKHNVSKIFKLEAVENSPEVRWRADSKCGGSASLPFIDEPAECDALGAYPCCSNHGWCGFSDAHCDCPSCVDYSAWEKKGRPREQEKQETLSASRVVRVLDVHRVTSSFPCTMWRHKSTNFNHMDFRFRIFFSKKLYLKKRTLFFYILLCSEGVLFSLPISDFIQGWFHPSLSE